MPYQDYTTGPWRGTNQNENPLSLRPGELRDSLNVMRYGEMLGTRPGTERPGAGEDYENQTASANAIRGAFEFREGFDEGRHLIVISTNGEADGKSNVWYEDDNRLPAGTPPTITAGSDYIWSFAMHNNLVWSTGGPPGRTQVQTESIWTWDGNTANGPTTRALTDKGTAVALFPKFLFAWNGYLLLNGLQQTTANLTASNNPMVTRYAEFASDVTVDANWKDSNTIGFNPSRPGTDAYGGNFSTGFGTYRDNRADFLLLLSNERIQAVRMIVGNDFAVTDAIANGCVHQRAFVSLGLDSGEAVYVSSGRGPAIHSLRQSQEHGNRAERFLSHKIQPFMDTLNLSKIHHTCGAYDRRNGILVFAMSTGSNTTHDTLVVLDVGDDDELTVDSARFYFWRLGEGVSGINHLLYARDASDDFHLYAFTHAGDVIRFTTDIYSDFGAVAYGIKIRTRDDPYGSLLNRKTLGDYVVPLQSLGSVDASVRAIFDLGRRAGKVKTLHTRATGTSVFGTGVFGTATFGATSLTHTDRIYGQGSGETIAFEITHESADEPIRVGPIQHQVLVAGQTDDSGASQAA